VQLVDLLLFIFFNLYMTSHKFRAGTRFIRPSPASNRGVHYKCLSRNCTPRIKNALLICFEPDRFYPADFVSDDDRIQ
ncbi:hypothetical protein, partial [Methanimicrococcus hacksteinii]|uniref:hypothetical protein n=1 Tax=Methanimicrococcus hacksteinii TaxID=3028293 RepID=UPI00298F0B18